MEELTTGEAAALKGVTRAAVPRAKREGRLPGRVLMPGGSPPKCATHGAQESRKCAIRDGRGMLAHGATPVAVFLHERRKETEREA